MATTMIKVTVEWLEQLFHSVLCITLIYLIKQCALAKPSRLGIMELKGIFNFKKSSCTVLALDYVQQEHRTVKECVKTDWIPSLM